MQPFSPVHVDPKSRHSFIGAGSGEIGWEAVCPFTERDHFKQPFVQVGEEQRSKINFLFGARPSQLEDVPKLTCGRATKTEGNVDSALSMTRLAFDGVIEMGRNAASAP